MDQDHGVFGVIHGEKDLLRGEADIDGMQDRAHARYTEVSLQVPVGIPVPKTATISPGSTPRADSPEASFPGAIVELPVGETA